MAQVLTVPSKTSVAFCRGRIKGYFWSDGFPSGSTKWGYSHSTAQADEIMRCASVLGWADLTRSGNQILIPRTRIGATEDDIINSVIASSAPIDEVQGFFCGDIEGEGTTGGRLYDATIEFVPDAELHNQQILALAGRLGASTAVTIGPTGTGTQATWRTQVTSADFPVFQQIQHYTDWTRVPGGFANPLPVTPPDPTPVGRNPALWPFHEDSIWNMPIGSTATFSGPFASPPYTTVNNFAVDPEPICLDPTAPVLPAAKFDRLGPNGTKAYWQDPATAPTTALGTEYSMRTPTSYFTKITDESWDQNTPNASGGGLMADGKTIREFNYGFRVEAAKWRIGSTRGTLDIYGDGLEFERGKLAWGGHGGSMLSGVGGSIRKGELFGTEPMRHAVKLTAWMKGFGKNIGGVNQKTWPAFTTDAAQEYGSVSRAGVNGILPMGALIAIPSTVNLATLGFETAPALKLAEAIQRFGCYIVDECGSDAWTQNLWCMEWGVVEEGLARGFNFGGRDAGAYPNPWSRDSDRILYACRMVTNNTATTIGGTGTRVYTKAPAFGVVEPDPGGGGTPSIKTHITGLVDRFGLPVADPALSRVVAVTINVNWSVLQPTQGGAVSLSSYQSQISAAVAAGKKVRLRIGGGNTAPSWVKSVGGTGWPCKIVDPVASFRAGSEVSGTVGKWWDPTYLAFYEDFITKLAALIEANTNIPEVTISNTGLLGSEPFVRYLEDPRWSNAGNKTRLLDLGWSTTTDIAAIKAGVDIHQRLFKKTRSWFSLAPYQGFNITTDARWPDWTLPTAQYAIAQLGDRITLASQTLRSNGTDISKHWGPEQIQLAWMASQGQAGVKIGIQTDTAQTIADDGLTIYGTLKYAAQNLYATSIEPPVGYESALTDAQMAQINAFLVTSGPDPDPDPVPDPDPDPVPDPDPDPGGDPPPVVVETPENMADITFIGTRERMATSYWTTGTFKALLLAGATPLPATALDPTLDTVAELIALADVDEATGAGYLRKSLPTIVVSRDETNNRVRIDCNDLTYTGLSVGTVRAFVVYEEGASDSLRNLVQIFTTGFPKSTNGGAFVVNIADLLRLK